jgi:hypothetical protein
MKELTPRQESLLLYIGSPGRSGDDGFVDPIRIMKGLFVFAQETPNAWRKPGVMYDFEPYHWGPCSFAIYNDLDALEAAGLVASQSAPGRTWKRYGLTPAGSVAYRQLAASWNRDAVAYLAKLRGTFSSMTFSALLEAVYNKYPAYALYSVFRR